MARNRERPARGHDIAATGGYPTPMLCVLESRLCISGAQVVAGLFQSTGWPSVVSIVANWSGKGKRGLIMGIWNAHTSVGNIAGTVLAAALLSWVRACARGWGRGGGLGQGRTGQRWQGAGGAA